jgi:molecular chaperone GrpE
MNKQNPEESLNKTAENTIENNELEQELGTNAEAETSENIEEAPEEINPLKSENAELRNKLVRLAAELENQRKRSAQQIAESRTYAVSNLAKDLTAVVDNFHLAIENTPAESLKDNQEFKQLFDGLNMTKAQLEKVLSQHGVQRFFPLGEQFDHNLHQVVSQIKSDEKSGTIVQVLQAGYMIGDRLLKAATVITAQ